MPGNFVTIELRKTNVDQSDLRLGIKNKIEAGSSVGSHLDVVTVESQEHLEGLARIGVIFDHDDPARRRQREFAI